MLRPRDDVTAKSLLNHSATIHDRNRVAEFVDDGEVVGDEQK
jgi:hypothetical protein